MPVTALVDALAPYQFADNVRLSPASRMIDIRHQGDATPLLPTSISHSLLPEGKRGKRNKLQMQHIKRLISRRHQHYHKWFFTLYEFDKPAGDKAGVKQSET